MRVVLFAATAVALIAAAPPSKDQLMKVMHDRHEGMESIGKANKAIRRELEGGSPNLAVVRQSAGQIAGLSRQASRWFPQGTGPELGKTGAKPEIWQNPKDFAAKLHNWQVAAQAFNAAAASNDAGAVRARFADMGGACKSCHDKYRMDMHH
jgi:cytochrome c556